MYVMYWMSFCRFSIFQLILEHGPVVVGSIKCTKDFELLVDYFVTSEAKLFLDLLPADFKTG